MPKQLSDILNNLKVKNKQEIKSAVSLNEAAKGGFNPDFALAPVEKVDTSQPAVNLASIKSQLDEIKRQSAIIASETAALEKEKEKERKKAEEVIVPQKEEKETSIIDKILGRKKEGEKERADIAAKLEETRKARAEIKPIKVEDILSKFGLNEKSFQTLNDLAAKIGTINLEIANVDEREQKALAAVEARTGTGITFRNLEANKIKRDFAVEKAGLAAQANAYAAQAETIRGNFNVAKSIANSYIQAATYERRQKIDDLNWAEDIYKDTLDELDKSERDQWDAVKRSLEGEQKKEESRMKAIRDFMTDPKTAGAFKGTPNPFELTLDETTELVNNYLAETPLGTTEFTTTQKLALEQAGLENSDRRTQLDYLKQQGFLRGVSGIAPITEFRFTRDETQTGAARVNVPLDNFNKFSNSAKNIIINNWGLVKDRENFIEQAIEEGSYTERELEKMVSESSMPPEIKDYLTKFLKSF